MASLQSKYKTRKFKQGECIIQEGDVGDCAYLVQSSALKIVREFGGSNVEIARVGAGDIIGETALVFDERRSASVVGTMPGMLIVIDRSSFKHKLEGSDPTIKAIVSMLSRRVQAGNKALIEDQADAFVLLSAVESLFKKVRYDLPVDHRDVFIEKAQPHIDAFIEAIKAMKDVGE